MSAKSMASIPRMLQPRCSARTLPSAERANISSRFLRIRTRSVPVVLDAGMRSSSSFNNCSYGNVEFMPDLQWSAVGSGNTPDSITGCVRRPLLAGLLNGQQRPGRHG